MEKISKILALSLCLAPALIFSSCATLFGDNGRSINISSEPEGADIYLDGSRIGTTPADVTLPSYIFGGKQIILKRDNYREQAIFLNPKFQPVGLWNLIVWPGFLIDAATGNIVKLDPNQLSIKEKLTPVAPAESKTKGVPNS